MKELILNETQQCYKHIVSNNEALESSSEGLAVCPECKSKDIRPYRDHYCCYGCGNYFKIQSAGRAGKKLWINAEK